MTEFLPAANPSITAGSSTGRQPEAIIGITGKIRLPGYHPGLPSDQPDALPEDAPEIRAAIRAFLQWVLDAEGWLDPAARRFNCGAAPRTVAPDMETGLWSALGLGIRPVYALSSLAPGTDTVFAEEVLRLQRQRPDQNLRLRAVLPFPLHLYRRSTSFVHGNHAEHDRQRVARFDRIIEGIRSQPDFNAAADLVEVQLHSGLTADPEHDLTEADDATGRPLRDRRYRAAGEYISALSEILLAVIDPTREDFDPQDPYSPGSEAVAFARAAGGLSGLLAGEQLLPPSPRRQTVVLGLHPVTDPGNDNAPYQVDDPRALAPFRRIRPA